jgi:alkane 1-monooxygenase
MYKLKKIGFFASFLLPLLVVVGYYGGGFWNYSNLIFVFAIIPIIDKIVGKDQTNVAESSQKNVSDDFFFRFVLYLWTIMQTIFLLWACYVVSLQHFTTVEYIGFLMGTMIVTGGVGITVAHELGHKLNELDRITSQFLLLQVCYTHFYIEHNRGHHVHIATPQDPATSRKGENFYRFWLRTVFGSYKSAWKLEKERLQRKNIDIWSWQNMMIRYIVITITLLIVLTLVFSLLQNKIVLDVPLFFILQSILGFSLLEAVNYIEHYGILRRKISATHYERVNPLHSWNASELVSNWFLFQLQRHADHHTTATKPYQVLNHIDDSPQLPAGYPTMILCALCPPLWFKIMNKELESWQTQYNKNRNEWL